MTLIGESHHLSMHPQETPQSFAFHNEVSRRITIPTTLAVDNLIESRLFLDLIDSIISEAEPHTYHLFVNFS